MLNFSGRVLLAKPLISLESGSEIPPPLWPVPRLPRTRTRKEINVPIDEEIELVDDDDTDHRVHLDS